MEIFLHDRIIHTRNARYLPSYSQRVMNNTKNSDHPTNPEYTSTHPKPNQSPIENVHPAPIHPKYTSTYLYPVNQKQTKKKTVQVYPRRLSLSSLLSISVSHKKCLFIHQNIPLANSTHAQKMQSVPTT